MRADKGTIRIFGPVATIVDLRDPRYCAAARPGTPARLPVDEGLLVAILGLISVGSWIW